MISDLLDLHKELRGAEDGAAKSAKADRFRARVESEIVEMFADPAYPKRRRTFGAIRKRFGPVFEGRDGELGQVLVDLGAHVHHGDGDDALWEFCVEDDDAWRKQQTAPAPFNKFKLGRFALIAAVALVLMELLLRFFGLDGIVPLIQSTMTPAQTHAECITQADGRFTEILSCHKEHGQLPPS